MKCKALLAILLSFLCLAGFVPGFLPNGTLAATEEEQKTPKGTIAIIGSSVAAGWVTSFEAKHDMKNGWAWRLGRLLEKRGYRTVNVAVPGDTTAGVLRRLSRDLSPIDPDFAIIGLSMANEGLAGGDPAAVSETFADGMKEIIELCRAREIVPVVASCYACDNYDPAHYEAIRRMNIAQNDWGVPIINLLGGLDDGEGHFPEGHAYDAGHPDNRGHEELFLTVVPGLFDALAAGKPAPVLKEGDGAYRFNARTSQRPLFFVPGEPIHSFTLAFSIRADGPGKVFFISSGRGMNEIVITPEGALAYLSSDDRRIVSENEIADEAWHDIVLSHRHLAGETLLFLDGTLIGSVHESLIPSCLVLSGPGSLKSKDARGMAYRQLLIYRAALNAKEVAALRSGTLLRGSLEIYAPLIDPIDPDGPVENLARSDSSLIIDRNAREKAYTAMKAKIATAAKARAAEIEVPRKEPIALDPKLFAPLAGTYEIAPGARIRVFSEGKKLYIVMPGQPKVEILPESATRFFVRFPIEEITVTFEMGGSGSATGLVVAVGPETVPAARVADDSKK